LTGAFTEVLENMACVVAAQRAVEHFEPDAHAVVAAVRGAIWCITMRS
jgi:hypothetical protein